MNACSVNDPMRHFTENSLLTIPNDLLYLPAIQAFISEVADKVGFSRRDTAYVRGGVVNAIIYNL